MNARELLARSRLDALLNRMNTFDQVGVQQTLQLLEELRQEVLQILASNTTAYERSQVSQILAALDDAVNRFQVRYVGQITKLQTQGFNLGVQVVDSPIRATSLTFGGPYVSQQLLELMTGYSADLVTNISGVTKAAISRKIVGGVLTGQTPSDVMKAIGSDLDQGVFKSIAARAATITRTEANRIMGAATFARLNQMGKSGLMGLAQQWDATNDARTRPEHHAADGQVRAIGEPFEVWGEQLRFPGDPSGSARNTINCRCRVLPYSANWHDIKTS